MENRIAGTGNCRLFDAPIPGGSYKIGVCLRPQASSAPLISVLLCTSPVDVLPIIILENSGNLDASD